MAGSATVYVDDIIDQQSLGRRGYLLIFLLMLALVCDGFDLQIVGVVAPLMSDAWGLKPAQLVGPVQSANLFGMMIGAIFLGSFGDVVGRKRLIVGGTLLYSLATLVALFASNVFELGVLRFITGLGLGGVLPNVIALTAEMTPRARRPMLTSLVILGMSLGSGIPGVVAALLAPTLGWESVFVVGAVVPIVIAVLLAFLLPESLLFLTNKGRDRAQIAQRVQAMAPALQVDLQTQFALRGQTGQQKAGYLELFSPGLRVTTPLLWVMFAGVLLSMHFLNSWISTVLKLGHLTPTQFSLTNSFFHWAGAIAAICTALLLGRLGIRWILVLLGVGMASLLTIATQGFANPWLLTLAVCGAGFGIIGCQGALNASAGLIYPASCRTTGVGAALGIGRIGSVAGPLVGGYVLGLGVPVQQMFFVPLVPLAMAVLATLVLVLRKVDVRNEGGGLAHYVRTMIFQTLRRQRGVIAAVLLAFLAFRALLPMGVMPAQGADGAWTVQLCTGQGLQTVVLDAAGHPGKPAAPAEHDTGYCALAGALVAASSPAAFSFVPVVSVARFLPPPSAVAVPRFALLRVQSARGPPFYS